MWEWNGYRDRSVRMEWNEILDVGSRTRVAFEWNWFGKALDVESNMFYSFAKSFLSFVFILLVNMQMKSIKESKSEAITCSWEWGTFYP